MKNAERKARIREILSAEGLGGDGEMRSSAVWDEFKKQVNSEFLTVKVPTLQIETKPKSLFHFWQWIPVFALVLFGVTFYLMQRETAKKADAVIATQQPAVKYFKKGDVFISQKREIRFLSGSATLTENANKIQIIATELKADFRLRQKVDMQIEHPLIRVTITGTEFSLDTTAKGGILNLTEGSLRIDMKTLNRAEPVILKAPMRFVFSDKSYRLKKAEPKKNRLLYRYELQNGEVFFAHLIHRDERAHRVEVLGGKVEQIAAEQIVRFVAVENPPDEKR